MIVSYKAQIPVGRRYKAVSGTKEYSNNFSPLEILQSVRLKVNLENNRSADLYSIEIEELYYIDDNGVKVDLLPIAMAEEHKW